MERGYQDKGKPEDKVGSQYEQTDTGEHDIVEFHSEMPQVPDEKVEFIPDDKLEDEVSEEI